MKSAMHAQGTRGHHHHHHKVDNDGDADDKGANTTPTTSASDGATGSMTLTSSTLNVQA